MATVNLKAGQNPFLITGLAAFLCLLSPFKAVAIVGSDEDLVWRPVDPSILALSTPRLDPEARAEVILWEVRVLHGDQTWEHHLRIKIFDRMGAKEHSEIHILASKNSKVDSIRGRTVKPDGRSIELEESDITSLSVVEVGKHELVRYSFILPRVEAGDVIEYEWREVHKYYNPIYQRLPLDREIPVWKVIYHIDSPYRMSLQTFNTGGVTFEKQKEGSARVEASSIPAYVPESFMPPEDEVRRWALLFSNVSEESDPRKYWEAFGKEWYFECRKLTKPSRDIRDAARYLLAGVTDPVSRIETLLDFCRNNIANIARSGLGLSAERLDDLKFNRTPKDTYKQRAGTAFDIAVLFTSLLRASDIDARIVLLSTRDQRFFDPGFLNPFFLNDASVVAAKVAGEWRFYDPASRFARPDMLEWPREGVLALLPDPEQSMWVETPLSAADTSKIVRLATLSLSPSGSISGKVQVSLTGHYGIEFKKDLEAITGQERVERIKSGVEERLPSAEISSFVLSDIDTPNTVASYSYEVELPHYAVLAGGKLLIQPSFFRWKQAPLFPAATRKHDICFTFGRSEWDRVIIKIPDGYTMEGASPPQSLAFGEIGEYRVMLVLTTAHEVVYDRRFVFGRDGHLILPASEYASVKRAFDMMHEQDEKMVLLQASPAEDVPNEDHADISASDATVSERIR